MADSEQVEEAYRPLPGGKLLTGLVQSMHDEVFQKARPHGAKQFYPIMSGLWDHLDAASGITLERDATDEAASTLRRQWDELDEAYGRPEDRLWEFSVAEVLARRRAIIRYLHSSGLVKLEGGEVDAPTNYLSEEELQGT